MGANCLYSGLRGPNTIEFADGQKIMFGFPSYRLGGTVMGERTIEPNGCNYYEDITNNRKAFLTMSSFKKTGWFSNATEGLKDEINGIIYVPKKKHKSYEDSVKKLYGKEMEQIYSLEDIKDVRTEICSCEGSWLRNIVIDGKTYWDVKSDVPDRQRPSTDSDVLASDWRYREDLIWLKYGDELIAHQWKIRLEV